MNLNFENSKKYKKIIFKLIPLNLLIFLILTNLNKIKIFF